MILGLPNEFLVKGADDEDAVAEGSVEQTEPAGTLLFSNNPKFQTGNPLKYPIGE
jgi:hypothetical protein